MDTEKDMHFPSITVLCLNSKPKIMVLMLKSCERTGKREIKVVNKVNLVTVCLIVQKRQGDGVQFAAKNVINA